MRTFEKLKLRVRSLWRRDDVESEMSTELRFHLEELIRENVAAGMPAGEARQAALRAMGGVAQFEEQIRDTRRVRFIETLVADVRYALRTLRKAPVFATVAVLSLALGTGANAAIFSLIDSVLLQRLPVHEPERLVVIRTTAVKIGNFNVSMTLINATLEHLKKTTQLTGMATVQDRERLNIAVDGSADVAPGQFVSGNYFDVLGVSPTLGRTLGEREDSQAAGANGWPAMISHSYWQRRFGGRDEVLGRQITVNTVPFTIVGVVPRKFRGLWIDEPADIVMPRIVEPQVREGKASGKMPTPEDHSGMVFGRLRDGVGLESAQAELTVLLHQALKEQKGESFQAKTAPKIALTTATAGLSGLRRRFDKSLRVLMAVVAMVMLIAAANIASLLLTRSAARQREICIRMSLGSSRWRMVRQLLTESMLLSVLGSALGLLFALWARQGIVKVAVGQRLGNTPFPLEWDWHLFAFMAGLCVLNALFFGVLPALKATKLNANLVLHSGRTVRTAGVTRLGKMLVSGQVALSLALLVGAVLLLRTLTNFYKLDLGYNHQKVLMATVDPRLSGYGGERSAQMFREILQRTSALPRVQSVSLIRQPLLGGSAGLTSFYVPGYVPTEAEKQGPMWIVNQGVGPNFFSTMQMPILAGRDFTDEGPDREGKVAVVNQAMVRHYFAGKNPIGQKIAWGKTEAADVEIVGIVGDAHYFGLTEEKQDVVFVPMLEKNIQQATLLVRTTGEPSAVAADVRGVIRAIDRNVPVYGVTTLEEMVTENLSQQRLLAMLSGFFGGLALVLSAIGLYGVLAYSVTRRTGEIGVRMALGATRGSILRLVFSETAQVLGAGIVVGIAVTIASARLIRSILYGVTPTDSTSMALAVVVLSAVALLAAFIPMRRAMRVDPMAALREE